MEIIFLWPKFPKELYGIPILYLSHYCTLEDGALKTIQGVRLSRMAV